MFRREHACRNTEQDSGRLVITTYSTTAENIMDIEQAIKVLRMEAEGIMQLTEKIDRNFTELVDLICNSKGRVVIGGIGKSGLIGKKIVATLNSTGTTSLFLHPVEAVHGDLGIVSKDDIFLALSNSGETDELLMLLPVIRNIGCPIVAFTGNKASSLAERSDLVIDVGTEEEACPMGLAPTTSTTALLAMGDALAVVLINRKGFNSTDFKRVHPGGSLGNHLSLDVREIMLTGEAIPAVPGECPLSEAVGVVNDFRLGAVLVTGKNALLEGIITDGDIRSFIASGASLATPTAADAMTAGPRFLSGDMPVYDALNMMERHQITVLPVCDQEKRVVGILHLHDILGKGEFKFNGS